MQSFSPVTVNTLHPCEAYTALGSELEAERELQLGALVEQVTDFNTIRKNIGQLMSGQVGRELWSGQTPDVVAKTTYTPRGQRIIKLRDGCSDCVLGMKSTDKCQLALDSLRAAIAGRNILDVPAEPEANEG